MVIEDLLHAKSGDTLLFNVGAHCQRSMTFVDWQRYVDDLAVALKKITSEGDVVVIWRSTWNVEENVFRSHPRASSMGGCPRLTSIPTRGESFLTAMQRKCFCLLESMCLTVLDRAVSEIRSYTTCFMWMSQQALLW